MRTRDHTNGVRTWHFALEGDTALAAVSTRHGGASGGPYATLNLGYHVDDRSAAVAENRRLLCEALAIERLTVPDQQHGARVVVVDTALLGAGHDSHKDAAARLPAADALITEHPDAALCVMVADCAPLVLLDRKRQAIGVVHAGRNGVVQDVIGSAVRAMRASYGSVPSELLVGIGPCVDRAHYEIGGAALTATRKALGDRCLTPTRPGHAAFDLQRAVTVRLLAAGVSEENIEYAGMTTTHHSGDFFSDRRERPCGRFVLVAALRSSRSR